MKYIAIVNRSANGLKSEIEDAFVELGVDVQVVHVDQKQWPPARIY